MTISSRRFIYGSRTKVVLPGGPTIEYVIDGQNRRVGRKVNGVLTQGWLYGDQLRIVAELDGSGALVSRFIAAVTAPNGTYRYAYSPTTGAIASVTAPDGGVISYTLDGALLKRTQWTGAVAAIAGATFTQVHVLRSGECLELHARAQGNTIFVSGAMLHSGLGAGDITVQESGKRVIVRVYLVPAGTGARREFAAATRLMPQVDEVWFGDPPYWLTCCSLAGRTIRLPVPTKSTGGRLIWSRRGDLGEARDKE